MSGRLRRPVGVGVAESEGLVYLGLLPAGPIHCLDAAGSLIWSVAVREPRSGSWMRSRRLPGWHRRWYAPMSSGSSLT